MTEPNSNVGSGLGPESAPEPGAGPITPDWYPDPMGRHEFRFWDGTSWTEHVSSHGRQSTDAMTAAPKTVTGQQDSVTVQKQVQNHARQSERRGATPPPPRPGVEAGGLLDQPLLVVNQKWKLIEVNTEFAVYDGNGTQIGAVRQVGQSGLKKVLRFVGSWDQYLTHKYQLVDAAGQPQLLMTRPAKFFKSRVIVQDGTGATVGEVIQRNMIGKIRFGFEVGGQDIGGIFAENWRAWNFSIKDADGVEVARITKTFEGLLKTAFTTADNYVLQVHRPLSDPLRQMVYASAVAVDTALKQDARGMGSGSIFDMFGG